MRGDSLAVRRIGRANPIWAGRPAGPRGAADGASTTPDLPDAGNPPCVPISTDEDHAAALAEIERLWAAEPGTADGDRLDVLAALVSAFEERRWAMEASDPIDVLRFCIEEGGRSQSDLAALLGSPSRASEVLRRKRPLTLPMIWKLHSEWGIPAELLIRPYATAA